MKTEIRIFVDAHVFDSEFQGTRTFIKGIYSIMGQKPGIQLYLGANDIENLKKNFPHNKNTFFIQYKTSSGIARLVYEIPSIIRKYNIDYAHFQYFVPPIRYCKFIVTIHDVIFNEYPDEFSFQYRIAKNFLYRKSALRADILTTVSKYSAQSIQKFLGIKEDKIIITPNGVQECFFEKYNKQEAKKFIKSKYGFDRFILYVSRIEPRKNHFLLLKSFVELKLYEKGYFLVLLGHESIKAVEFNNLYNNLESFIKQYIFKSSEIDDNELLQFYRATEVFVYPSKAEGFGIPPLEAAALEIPVICSNTSAMSDFIFFNENHIDASNFKLLSERLYELTTALPNENELHKISQIIRENYSWKQSAETLYQAILNKKNSTFAASK
jgi:glycosyltransferase involved in cell wall biosynthesis